MSLSRETKELSPAQQTFERFYKRNLCRQEDEQYDNYIKSSFRRDEKPISEKGIRFAEAFYQEISKIINDAQIVSQESPAFKAFLAGGTAIAVSDILINTLFGNNLDDKAKSTLKTGGVLAGLYVGYRTFKAVKPEVYNATVLLYIFDHLEGNNRAERFQNVVRGILFRFERNIEILKDDSIIKFARYFAENIRYNINHQLVELSDCNPDEDKNYVNQFLLKAALHFDKSDKHSPLRGRLTAKTLEWVPNAVKGKGEPTIWGIVANSPCVSSDGKILVSVQKMEKTKESKLKNVVFKYPLEFYNPTLEAQSKGKTIFKFFENTRKDIMETNGQMDDAKLLRWLTKNCVPVKQGQSLEEYQAALENRLQPK